MRYIQHYNDYQKIDEGLKNWVAGTPEEKKEFVDDLKGTDHLNKLGKVGNLESIWSKFKQENGKKITKKKWL